MIRVGSRALDNPFPAFYSNFNDVKCCFNSSEAAITGTTTVLGRKIKEIREEKRLTLKQVAERAHVTASFISQLERGKANPSLSTLKDIADLFGTTIGTLLDSPSSTTFPCQVLKKGQRRSFFTGKNAKFELLSRGYDLNCELVVNEYAPGASTGTPFTHPGFECGYVISGRLRVELAGEAYLLSAGDSITFPSTIPHLLANPTKRKTMALWVNSIPWMFEKILRHSA